MTLLIIAIGSLLALGALAALTEEQRHITAFEAILDRRRSLICERLDAVPHVFRYVRPQGAYYVFPRILVEHGQDPITVMTALRKQLRNFGTNGEFLLSLGG